MTTVLSIATKMSAALKDFNIHYDDIGHWIAHHLPPLNFHQWFKN